MSIPTLEYPNPNHQCKCVGKHIPKPLNFIRQRIWPMSEEGLDIPENFRICLCPTSHENFHSLWNLYEETNGRPPWDKLKSYSEYVRGIVEMGRELRRQHTTDANLSVSS